MLNRWSSRTSLLQNGLIKMPLSLQSPTDMNLSQESYNRDL